MVRDETESPTGLNRVCLRIFRGMKLVQFGTTVVSRLPFVSRQRHKFRWTRLYFDLPVKSPSKGYDPLTKDLLVKTPAVCAYVLFTETPPSSRVAPRAGGVGCSTGVDGDGASDSVVPSTWRHTVPLSRCGVPTPGRESAWSGVCLESCTQRRIRRRLTVQKK